jgi:hypothetical protein
MYHCQATLGVSHGWLIVGQPTIAVLDGVTLRSCGDLVL